MTNIVPSLVEKTKTCQKDFKKYLFKMENDFIDLKLKLRGKGLFDLFLSMQKDKE